MTEPDLLALFAGSARGRLATIEDALLAASRASVGRAPLEALAFEAHALRGAAAVVKLPAVQAVAGRVEDAARDVLEGRRQLDRPLLGDLRAWLDDLVGAIDVSHAAPLAPPPATACAGTRATVLCVEDDPTNLALLRKALARRAWLAVETAGSGAEALALLEGPLPELVLLDLHLPGLGGEAVLRALRGAPRTHVLPVAVISADATPATQARLLAAGATAYLTKPIVLDELLALVDDVCGAGV